MKISKIILSAVLMIACGLWFTACNQSSSSSDNTEEKSGKEYTSAYICPMHCAGSGSDTAGKCPVCGMDYVANADQSGHEGHDHGSHEGHDHGSHEGHDHDSHEGHNH